MKPTEQIATMQELTQTAAAWLLATPRTTLGSRRDVPRQPGGRYDGRDLLKWFHETAEIDMAAIAKLSDDQLCRLTEQLCERLRERADALEAGK